MEDKKKQATANHKKGFNCAQSIACLYAEELGYSEAEVFKMTEAFGLGMGTMSTCGVVSAMAVIAGMKNSDGNTRDPKTKKDTYKLIKELYKEFETENQSTVCATLKGVKTGTPVKSCDALIESGVEILEKSLFKR